MASPKVSSIARLFASLSVLFAGPALALPPDQVVSKLDGIILFAPVGANGSSQPVSLKYTLDGVSRSVFFAALSPAAVQQVINDRIRPQNSELTKALKFAPFSLAKFDSIVQPILQKDADARVIYVPDPVQVPVAERLLVAQGLGQADAKKISTTIPIIFCPQPLLTATPNSGPLKGQSFAPCSTDYETVKSLLDKGVASNPGLKASNPRVVAIPLTSFVSMLTKGSNQDVGAIRVLPSPATVKTIEQLRALVKPSGAPSGQ